jgi:hypothetical protein
MDAATLEQVEEALQSIHQFILDFGDIDFGEARLDAILDCVRGLACSAKDKLAALARWKKQGLLQHAETEFTQLIRELFVSSTAIAPQVGDSCVTTSNMLAAHSTLHLLHCM